MDYALNAISSSYACLSETLLAFVGSHLMPFSLFSAWHIVTS